MSTRRAIAGLFLSAAAFVGLVASEGYEPVAKPPVAGDVPTNGFGSTGSDIKLGDKTDPVRALVRALKDADQFQLAVQRCVKVPMHQHEFDAAVRLAYNIGPTAFCSSTVVKRFNVQDYTGACDAFRMWIKFKGQTVKGLVNRREREYRLCMGEAT
ncbi:lysozyme [Azohydromonas lata]|uniref:Lysozyme n=1 Tax=Azohydromonas lata TaxID=45677 RepID=A0ABU5IGD5_9BURK|nr:lysozyme [Azohydromonas lata]MDZ5457008.1 lysozyme [Azohydromonas lata]